MPDEQPVYIKFAHEIVTNVAAKMGQLPIQNHSLVVIASIEAVAGVVRLELNSQNSPNSKSNGHTAYLEAERLNDYIYFFEESMLSSLANGVEQSEQPNEVSELEFEYVAWMEQIGDSLMTHLSRLPLVDRDLLLVASIESIAKAAVAETLCFHQENPDDTEAQQARISEYAKIFAVSAGRPQPLSWVTF